MCKAGEIAFVNINGNIIKAIIVKKDGDKIYVTDFNKKDNKIYEISKYNIVAFENNDIDKWLLIIWIIFIIDIFVFFYKFFLFFKK